MAFDPLDSSMDQETVDEIVDTAIAENDVVLFMKGTLDAPQCGFSDRASTLVTQHRPDVHDVDVLASLDEFRNALEDRSGWETIPQTFVDGEFVGGSDVLAELDERGELADELDAENAPPADEIENSEDDTDDSDVDAPF